MTNALCVLLYAPLFVANLILLPAITMKDTKRFVIKQYAFFCINLLVWQLCAILNFVVRDAFVLRYLFDMKLAAIAFLSVALFMMVAGFYRLERKFPKWLYAAIYVIPAVTAVLAFTSPWHTLLLQNYEVVAWQPLVTTVKTRGVWFWVHTVYSQLLPLGSCYIILSRYRKLPPAYRTGPNIMIVCMALFYAGTIAETFKLESTTLDFTLIAVSLDSVLLYLAAVTNGRTNYLQIERREIFNYLDESVFILNGQKRIADANQPAVNWLRMLGCKLEYIPFRQMMDELVASGKLVRRASREGAGEDLYLVGTAYPVIYNMRWAYIHGQDGSFITLTDVTRNRLLIERLRETAGVDPLTGLANRYRYQELLRELDRPENLPLSVVVGDVNGLKTVNDEYGHSEGDKLLASIAEVLAGCCPENGHVARTGGDEFALLLPRCHAQGALRVMECVRTTLADIQGLRMPPSIAMGCATKHRPGENLNLLINEADKRMYGEKAAEA